MGREKSVGQITATACRYARALGGAVATLVPKVVFGNSVGLRHNVVPRLDLWNKRAAFSKSGLRIDENAAASAAELAKRGVRIFRHEGQHTSQLRAIRSKLTAVYEDPQLCVDSPNGTQRRIISPLKALPELATLISPEVADVICAYYGCAFRIFSVQAWRNVGVECPAEERDRRDYMSNTLHNDYWPVTHLRLFVILSDEVTKETGAFRFHDKPTTRATMRSLGYFDRFLMPKGQREALYDPHKLYYFEGRLGDACLVNTQEVLHGSSVPRAGAVRDVVQYLIIPDSGPPLDCPQLFENLPEDPEMQAFLRQAGRLEPV